MEVNNLLPTDSYQIVSKSMFNGNDKEILLNLYQPLIGSAATSLFLSLLNDLGTKLFTEEVTHYHLTSKMQASVKDLVSARKLLEGIGLIKTYYDKEKHHYLYLLYAPLSPDEFFNHPILNILLYSSIGKTEYEKLKALYALPKINLSKYQDITAKTDQVFKIMSDPSLKQNVSFKAKNSYGPSLNTLINLDEFPNLNKETTELINALAFVYNLDTIAINNIINNAITEKGNISMTRLRKNARSYYQEANHGELPSLIHRSQPEYLKTPSGDVNKRAKMIYVFENTSPYTFLASKNNHTTPTNRELRLIEYLMVDLKMKPGVVNVLIDYVLRTNESKLHRSLIETIASHWLRLKIETVPDAMAQAEKEYKRTRKTTKGKQNKAKVVPSWFDAELKKEEAKTEEHQELVALISKYE